MRSSTKYVVMGIILLVIAAAIIVHHYVICGRLYDLPDILHHEWFEAIFITAGIILLLVGLIGGSYND
jgi:uncharacterized membrane protein